MIKEWFCKMFGNEITLRERLFRIMLWMASVTMILAIISNIVLKESIYILITLLAGFLVLVISLWICYRFKRMNLSATILAIAIDWIMFPIIFFASGGIESGATVWFVLGIIFVFLLFDGKKMVFILTVTLGVFGSCYIYGYLNPDKIMPMASDKDVSFDSAMAVLIVSVVIGVLIKFLNLVYERERRITEQHKKELEEINLSKSNFFANMSHEIRTPINTIVGLNEMILREDISDEIAENAIDIQNASKMLLSLINDILDLSKIESGKMEIVPTQYETSMLFRELVNMIWIRAREKKLEFRINIDPEMPVMLCGDEVRIRQVVLNLLTNAVKYTQEGDVTLSAKCERIDTKRIRMSISVSDTGTGIRKESMKELFTSFRRVDQEKNKNIEGTGLGLSISKQLIELMRGKIEVDSIYTKGSTFTVTLEQEIIDDTPLGNIDFMVKRKVHNRQKYQQSFEAPDAKILIVDDDEMNLNVAVKLLRSTKVQVDVAHGGKECLEKTLQKSYHVIFMDHMMPELDGVETLYRIRRQVNGLCKRTPVIALTANVMNDAQQLYHDYGFEGYLSKPINGTLFEATLLKYLPAELLEYSLNSEQGDVESLTQIKRNKKPIYITTECVCDIPQKYIEQFEVGIMYYYVVTKQAQFQDVKEIDSDNLLEYLKVDDNHAYSHYASEEEYESFFADALEKAEQVIHLSIAQNVQQGGYHVAKAAAASFDHVLVYDTGHLSSGMGIMVLMAAQMVQDHKSRDEIIDTLNSLKKSVSTSFIVPTIESLYRNKIVSKKIMLFCNAFSLHPILYLSQSRLKCRGFETGAMEHAYQSYIRLQLRHKKSIDTRVVFITYAGCSLKQLHDFADEVQRNVKFDHVIYQQASASISCNCGLGALGIIFMRK